MLACTAGPNIRTGNTPHSVGGIQQYLERVDCGSIPYLDKRVAFLISDGADMTGDYDFTRTEVAIQSWKGQYAGDALITDRNGRQPSANTRR
jgi:hypothetical protein